MNSDWSTIDWSRKFYFDVSKVTGYTQRCDSIDFTTKAGRAGPALAGEATSPTYFENPILIDE